jgi:hypothetical protein
MMRRISVGIPQPGEAWDRVESCACDLDRVAKTFCLL